MTKICHVNHVAGVAPSGAGERIRWFYGEMLGLPELEIPPALKDKYEIFWFQMPNQILHIACTHDYVRPKEQYERGYIFPGFHFALEVKGISALKNKFKENHIQIREAEVIPDRERFYVIDPFGNFIEIIEFKTNYVCEP